MHRDDDIHVIQERPERGGVLRAHLRRRDVPTEVGRLHDRVQRRTRGVGSSGRNDIGDLLEGAPVVRHEAERGSQLDDLLDARMGEQLVEHPAATRRYERRAESRRRANVYQADTPIATASTNATRPAPQLWMFEAMRAERSSTKVIGPDPVELE